MTIVQTINLLPSHSLHVLLVGACLLSAPGLLAQDTAAPSVPTGLNGAASSSSSINLTWLPSSDNVGVSAYQIYRNGTLVGTSSTFAYSDTGLAATTSYAYRVAATDAATNASAQCAAINLRTDGATESVHTIRRRFISTFTPEIKANLRSIKLRGDALGRVPGRMGQWGDSITMSNAYLGALCSWGLVSTPPVDGHNYVPILMWLGATPGSANSPAYRFKGGQYCNESGWRVTNALDVFDTALPSVNPSWSLTMYGTNDIRQTGWNPANYELLLERFLRLNIDAGVVPTISTIPPCTGWDVQVAQANVVIRRVAARMNLPLAELHDLYTTLHPTDWATVLLGDGVHPSWTGASGDLSETPQRNDGYNVRTMLTVDMAEKIQHVVFNNGPVDGAELPIVVVQSTTHPYDTLVNATQATFQVVPDSGPAPTAYSWTLDQAPYTVPDTTSDGTSSTIATPIPQPGTWYFHVRANSSAGWGPTVHYTIRAVNAPTVELRYNGETVSPCQDTAVIASWGGNDNFGGASNLNLYFGPDIGQAIALFRFDVSSAASSGLQSAVLTLGTEVPVTTAYNYRFTPVTSSWVEGTGTWANDDSSGVTWATRPTLAASPFAIGTLASGQSQIQLDVTSLVQGWLANPASNYGIAFEHLMVWAEFHPLTREYGDKSLRPTLRLTYASSVDVVVPSSPSALTATANGSAAVNLAWTAATDNVGVVSYRIYRNAVLVGSSTATTFADTGLEPATTSAYTVRAVDLAGNEGPAASVSYSTPTPTLYVGPDQTIVLPAGASLDATLTGLSTTYTVVWSQLTGPANARLVNPTNPYSAVYFPQSGTYSFRCTVTTSTTTYTDEISFTVQVAPANGRTVNVSTVTQLRAAILGAADNDTILLADGTYNLSSVRNTSGGTWLTLNGVKNVVIQSAANDPTAVILTGTGFTDRSDNADGLWIQRSQCVTVRALTFSSFGAYGIKLEASLTPLLADIRIENCRFLAIGMRCIKGTQSPAPATDFVHRGWVRNCTFENTALPPTVGSYSGDYIAGLDLMCLSNWELKDSTYRNIQGETAGGRAAIFVWNNSRGLVVERNTITGCDRGISFGNPSGTTPTHAIWSVARNNLIVMQRSDALNPDEAIELAYVANIKIHHNTVWRANATGRGLRCSATTTNCEVANNLIRGTFTLLAGTNQHHNLYGALSGELFTNTATADFHLANTATTAIDQGAPTLGVTTDIAGGARDAAPDLGAYEYGAIVAVPPTITTQPTSQTTTTGATITFTAVASGTPSPTYQWQRNDAAIPGATGSSYTVTGVTLADAGSYTVVGTNAAGSVTSTAAMLTVRPAEFDITGYYFRNPTVAATYGTNHHAAWLHYRNTGIYNGETFDELFRIEEYLALYPELFALYGSDLGAALEHWLTTGKFEGRLGRIPTGFSAPGYFARNPDVATAVNNDPILAWEHFWLYGIYEGRAFDEEFRVFEYLALNADLQAAFLSDWRNGTLHWLRYGRTEGRLGRIPLIFSSTEYLTRYPEVATSWGTYPTTVWLHFWLYGIDEARTFDEVFRVDEYLAQNPDLAAVFGTNRRGAFSHWVRYGQAEGRRGRNP